VIFIIIQKNVIEDIPISIMNKIQKLDIPVIKDQDNQVQDNLVPDNQEPDNLVNKSFNKNTDRKKFLNINMNYKNTPHTFIPESYI